MTDPQSTPALAAAVRAPDFELDLDRVGAFLAPQGWGRPRPFGPSGLVVDTVSSNPHSRRRMIITDGPAPGEPDDVMWRHASVSRPNRMPDYDDLVLLAHTAWHVDGYAYQVFPGRAEHVNIHEHALHLWGYPDGRRILPAFGANGSI